MIHVIHIHKKHARFPKNAYSSSVRESFHQWNQMVKSSNGFVKDDVLILPKELEETIDVNRVGIIVIQDIYGFSEKGAGIALKHELQNLPDWWVENRLNDQKECFAFNKENRRCDVELFSIEKNETGELEFLLRYSNSRYLIGLPTRSDHKLCPLKIGKSLRILINGQSDFTMSRGKQREYNEFDFIIQYLGEVKTIEFFPPTAIQIDRKIPFNYDKVIDLRRAFH